MKTKYTPAPWKAGRSNISGLDHRVYANETMLIADCDGQQGYTNAVADARLIAAAPDLLEALQDIYNDLKQGAIPNHDDEWWERARAAIARATGEQP